MRLNPSHLLGVLVLTAAGLALVPPAWVRAAGLDFWSVRGEYARLAQCEEEWAELTAGQDRDEFRRRLTDDVVARLIRGTVSLGDAGREVEELLREFQPDRLAAFQTTHYPESASLRGAVLCYLAAKITSQLASDPPHQYEVLSRLRAELDALSLDSHDRTAVRQAMDGSYLVTMASSAAH